MVDYAVDSKSYREALVSNKCEAEQIQAKIQTDLTPGRFQIQVYLIIILIVNKTGCIRKTHGF